MPEDARVQMAVEAPLERVRLIRIAGNLDRAAAARLLRLIDAQCALLTASRCQLSDLLIDLENVRSFEPGGLEAARHARDNTAGRGVRIHLAGCAHHLHLLPLRVCQILGEFNTFPTVEIALTELGRAATAGPENAGSVRASDAGRAETPVPPASVQRHDGPGDLRSGSRISPGSALDPVGLPPPRCSPEWEPSAARPDRRHSETYRAGGDTVGSR